MKNGIFLGISALIALVYVEERNSDELPPLNPIRAKVYTTEELIKRTELNHQYDRLELRQDSVTKMIRDVVKNNIVDSMLMKKDSMDYVK